MFEKATRLKLRFNYKGVCTVEDLWDLSLKNLDSMFKELNSQLKTQKEESLLDTKSNEDTVLELKIAIIKHIVEVKLNENKAKTERLEKVARKQKLLEIIAEKQDEQLKNMSLDDLTKLVDEL